MSGFVQSPVQNHQSEYIQFNILYDTEKLLIIQTFLVSSWNQESLGLLAWKNDKNILFKYKNSCR